MAKKKKKGGDGGGLPGWFATFSDMMTLLFAFFVLMFSLSTVIFNQLSVEKAIPTKATETKVAIAATHKLNALQ